MVIAKRSLLFLPFLVILFACAANQTGSTTTPQSSRAVLATTDLKEYTDAYTAVSSLRPLWLRQRGATSMRQREPVIVYVDDVRMGGPEVLKQIMVSSVSSIRYMDAIEATNRWGIDHGNGAIMVVTRK